ncbi:MAG: response regulator transcription factor [Elusimicrobiota bacterium]
MATKQRILAVDDDPGVRAMLQECLGRRYDVSTLDMADDIDEAVSDFEPDLIILDVMMPGPDGISVCRQLRARASSRDIPILFLTALHDDEEYIKGLSAGCDSWITKPFSPADLTTRIEFLLKPRSAS